MEFVDIINVTSNVVLNVRRAPQIGGLEFMGFDGHRSELFAFESRLRGASARGDRDLIFDSCLSIHLHLDSILSLISVECEYYEAVSCVHRLALTLKCLIQAGYPAGSDD